MLHMIGNAHLDPVWLWRWTEGCAEAIGTCWAAIDRLDEGPGFVFTRGEAQVYAWIEAMDPPLFERIRHYVAERRWVVVNGWWVQPDCNLPSGESFIRQALYGKRYFADRFGIDVTVGYNVDSFGHAATLPMLLRHTGSDGYVFMRPGPHEMALPGELFDWVAPDGSRVTAFRIQIAYHTAPRQMQLDEKIALHLGKVEQSGHPFMCFYGVGNHGGGPTREAIAEIEAWRGRDQRVGYSDPAAFFAEAAQSPRPEVASELQFHAIGCYAVASRLKALNRQAEARLEQAEAAATLAWREISAEYPRETFEALWRVLLFNQFHDTLGGTSIESACEDAVREFGGVIAGADAILNASARHLARTIRPLAEVRDPNLLVMNFSPASFDGIVEAEPWTDFEAKSPRRLVDEDGRDVAFQFASPDSKKDGVARVAFRLKVPGYGYRLLRYPADPAGLVPPGVSFGAPLPTRTTTVETDGWRLEIDGATGAIAALVNKASGVSAFTGPAHRGIVVDDPTDTWSHGIDRFGFDGEEFSLFVINEIDGGPVRRAVEIVARCGENVFATTVLLPNAAEVPVDLRVRIDWREQRKLLRIAYPLQTSRFEYEVPAGWTERADDGRETFGHRWVRAARPDATVVIANDAKYSYAAADGTLYITAIRAPVYAHHDPIVLRDGASYRYMDQGEQLFCVHVHAAPEISRRGAMAIADGLLKPPFVSPHVARGGTKPHRGQWLDVAATTAAVTALKVAEDGGAAILRAIELDGAADRIAVGGAGIGIGPRGIVTARLDAAGLRASDGLER